MPGPAAAGGGDGAAVAKLSQPAAAESLAVKVDTYRSWEHGRRECPAEVRARMVEKWGADPKALELDDRERCPTCGRAL